MQNYIALSIPQTALYNKFSELIWFFCNSHVTKKEQGVTILLCDPVRAVHLRESHNKVQVCKKRMHFLACVHRFKI